MTGNIILEKRLKDIGPVSAEMCRKYGASGPVARGSGINFDVRKNEPYSVYPEFDFDIPVYHECDSFARYKVRMDEMEQSLRIIEQGLEKLPDGPIMPAKSRRTSNCRPETFTRPWKRHGAASASASSVTAGKTPIVSNYALQHTPTCISLTRHVRG